MDFKTDGCASWGRVRAGYKDSYNTDVACATDTFPFRSRFVAPTKDDGSPHWESNSLSLLQGHSTEGKILVLEK
jgi:hypothetical protein